MNALPPVAETHAASLPAERLYAATDASTLNFTTTAELQPLDGLLGQDRAHEAIRFGPTAAICALHRKGRLLRRADYAQRRLRFGPGADNHMIMLG